MTRGWDPAGISAVSTRAPGAAEAAQKQWPLLGCGYGCSGSNSDGRAKVADRPEAVILRCARTRTSNAFWLLASAPNCGLPPMEWPVTPNGRWVWSDNHREGMRQAVTLCGNRGFTSIREGTAPLIHIPCGTAQTMRWRTSILGSVLATRPLAAAASRLAAFCPQAFPFICAGNQGQCV